MDNNNHLLEKLVIEIHKEMSVMVSDIAAIKVDLKEHIRRTNLHEIEIKYIKKHLYYAQGAIGLIMALGSILGVAKLFIK